MPYTLHINNNLMDGDKYLKEYRVKNTNISMLKEAYVTSQNGQCRGERIQNQDVGPTRYILIQEKQMSSADHEVVTVSRNIVTSSFFFVFFVFFCF